MRKIWGIVVIAALLILYSGTAFAGLTIDESTNQGQQQGQGQAQGQIGINKQGQAQGQIGINKQGQAQGQGQVGINKATGSGNETSITTVNDQDTEVLAPTWASTPSTDGKEEASVYSLWGGINKNEMSFDKKVKLYLELLGKAREGGQITMEEYDEGVLNIVKWTKANTAPDKAFGIIPKVCDNPIINIALCW